ncbi:MAG TPA: hypothetical protein VFT37_06765 [Telluria sp.]|nr:hypothetical protein [Telluria sp.]
MTSSPQWLIGTCLAAFVALPAAAQTKSEIEAAKAALELKIFQATADSMLAQRDAEARKATAEAERAELLARLPPSTSKALSGTADVSGMGAAGLVKAVDLARELAAEVCASLPRDRRTAVYDAAATQGVVTARIVHDGIAHMNNSLVKQAKELQAVLDEHAPAESKRASMSALGLAAGPATIKAIADITSLLKTDVTAEGIAYGDGARALFVSALGQACPEKIAGLGQGYMGELDSAQHDQLIGRVRALVNLRGENANRVALIERIADASKGDLKKELSRVADGAGGLLKAVDAFVESLRVGETGDRSPLYNAARYLGYANRVRGALVLDFDLRLEGMTLVKDNLFTGQHLRLSGVAFLWYRLHEADGRLLDARVSRRITKPVSVDLRAEEVGGEFWESR